MAVISNEPLRLTSKEILQLPKLKISIWTEYLGEYLGSMSEKGIFHLAFSINWKRYRISVPIKSKEREILDVIEVLDDSPFQKRKKKIRLGILFTDNPEEPIRMRRIL
jgi:hypothetical protein